MKWIERLANSRLMNLLIALAAVAFLLIVLDMLGFVYWKLDCWWCV